MFGNLIERFGQTVGIRKQEEEDEESFFYTDTLPSTFQTTSQTTQSIVELSATQRMFLTDHANDLRVRDGELTQLREKLEDDGPLASASVNPGQWSLHDVTLSDIDAVDVIRSSPDIMSELQFQLFSPAPAGFLSSFRKFFSFSSQIDVRESSIATEIGFSLSVAEVVEAYTAILKTVSATLANPPKLSEKAFVSRLYELKSSHRGRDNSVYLLIEVELTNRTMSRGRDAMALNVATEFNIYNSQLFGADLPVVSMIEDDPSSLAISGMSRAELIDVLFSEDATFLSKSNLDVVVDAETGSGALAGSRRATNVAFHSTKRLVNAANTASSQFSRKVHEQRKLDIQNEWNAEQVEIAAAKAEAEAEAEAFQQQQQPRGGFGDDGYDDDYYDDDYDERGVTLPEREARNFLENM